MEVVQMSYQERSDLKLSDALLKLAGPDGETFEAFHHDAIARADGQIPNKYRELVALGVAFTTQCPLCVDLHTAGPSGMARLARKSPRFA
jgi:AhpD family alkylhydroperoxidase